MRPLLVRSYAFAAAMAGCLTALAIVGVRTNEHPRALVVGHDLVEVGIVSAAERTRGIEAIRLERMILEIQRHHPGIRRDRIDALLAAGAEQLQRRAIVHFGIVELW